MKGGEQLDTEFSNLGSRGALWVVLNGKYSNLHQSAGTSYPELGAFRAGV